MPSLIDIIYNVHRVLQPAFWHIIELVNNIKHNRKIVNTGSQNIEQVIMWPCQDWAKRALQQNPTIFLTEVRKTIDSILLYEDQHMLKIHVFWNFKGKCIAVHKSAIAIASIWVSTWFGLDLANFFVSPKILLYCQ